MQDSGVNKKDKVKRMFPQEQSDYTRGGECKVMKKVVNSVLASALALTVAPMVVGAEEATQAPQMDPGLQKTVKRLSALGLIQGYGNGDYGTDRSITRAEFATLVVRARGLEEGAKLAQFQSNFTDVKPSDWFSGYVNVASGQEIVKGYTDQTFKAGNNVTYAEAVAMIIRSLGYDPAVKGVWPNNYIAKASELGISKGVKVTPDKPATRGDVFIMLDNSLNVGLMKQVEYGTDVRFEIYDGKNGNQKKTLLSEYLNVDVYDQDWANKNGNKSQDLPFVSNVPVMGLGTLKANEVSFTGSALKGTYKVADGINVNGFVGQHVQVWVKDDREDYVVWMENSDDEDVLNLRTDTVYLKSKIQNDGKNISKDNLDDVELKFDNDKTYSLAKNDKGNIDVKVVYNFKTYSRAEEGLKAIADINGKVAASAKVVLNSDGDISYINVFDDATADQANTGVKYGSEVIEKIDATKQKITNLEDGSFDLKDKEEGKDFLVYINGELKKLADLQPMDVYSVYYPEGKKDKYIIMATRQVVEGKVDKVDARKDGDNRLVIGDKTYRIRSGVSYTDNAGKDIKKPTDADLRDKLRDLDGVAVKVYLGADGRIRHIETKDNVNDRRFKAIVTKDVAYDNSTDKYTFVAYTEKGTKQTVSVDAEDIEWSKNGEELTDAEIMKNLVTVDANKSKGSLHLVEITLNSKGDVDKVKVLDDVVVNELSGQAWDDAADEDDLVLNVKDENGKKHSYDVTDSTVVFDMTGEVKTSGNNRHELKDPRLAKFKAVAKDNKKTVYYTTDDNELEYVFVVAGGSVSDNNEYGYVKTFTVSGGDDAVVLLTRENGELKEVTYKLDGSVKDAQKRFNRWDFIEYGLNGDNEVVIKDAVKIVDGNFDDDASQVKVLSNPDAADLDDIRTGKVTKVDGKKITFEYLDEKGKPQTDTLFTTASTAFFNTDFEDITSVNEDDYVVLIDTDDDGSNLDYVIVVTDQDEVDENDWDMKAFLGSKATPEPSTDLVDFSKVTPTVYNQAGVKAYQVAGAKGAVDTTKVKSLQVKIGTKTYDVEINADGSFDTGKKLVFGDVTSYTLIVTDKDGKVTETKKNF
ncbi:S-layer homology domain-containing protein [Brevibacillus fluminis]|uniref:S-layer homology domain-containing protein n=1 Tax=Brevibacillus fluminis TaxID=511487 RepID=UPI003F8B4187